MVDSRNRAYKYVTLPRLIVQALSMCNDYRLKVDVGTIIEEFADLKIRIRFNEGVPNLEPRDDIKITDRGPIIRRMAEAEEAELVQRRWSWPGPNKRPVYNFRSEGRDFTSNRCLILADGFYEFTEPKDPAKKRKDKWLFTMPGKSNFCLAGIWRFHSEVGEAFTMLTTAPGPDVAPYHDRQIVILEHDAWAGWLHPTVPAQSLIRPLPAGALAVEQVG
jgi:putative SOS response-associated peptidase YedK